MQVQVTPENERPCRDILSKHFAQAKDPDSEETLDKSCLMGQYSVEEGNSSSACVETVTMSQRADTVRRLVSAR